MDRCIRCDREGCIEAREMCDCPEPDGYHCPECWDGGPLCEHEQPRNAAYKDCFAHTIDWRERAQVAEADLAAAAAVNASPLLAAEVKRLTALMAAARVAVEKLPMDGHQIDCSALLDPDDDDPGGWCDCHMMTTIEELRRAVGLEG